ncbi:MAG: YebC/PmpR family DNA-binding transcriptional regulator [Oscillospiraceae bacterium]|jgi:YebC/PmpR family DNA-binding regulatory protein|nr:YebC/PmpR family DNA-binding transcriptional regulator [Oscillospiraceae bacterium]
MSGHSKWKNIAHKKEKTDAQRAKIFTKLSREIIVAVREGGPDPASNARLKDVIAKARAGNVPSDNIRRVIERAAGGGAGETYESIRYEGYGPAGVAVIVETMTDNRNRTASEMRHYFDKNGGNLGPSGCVAWSFDPKGVIVVERAGRDEDDIMMTALEAGAADFAAEDEVFEIYTAPEDFGAVCETLEKKDYTLLSAQVELVPQTYVALTDEEQAKGMQRLLDMLEDNDDVQNVWHNWDE